MQTVYLNFDNTIANSNQQVINILNQKFGLSKSKNDLKDYNYNSIAPITEEEKLDILRSDEFFADLNFEEGFLEVIDKYKSNYKFIVVSEGTSDNLAKKESWLREKAPCDIEFIGIDLEDIKKKNINMRKSIQINSCVNRLQTNAELKILYKGNMNYAWQKGYANMNINVVDTWKQIDEILGFYSQYDYNTLSKKGE